MALTQQQIAFYKEKGYLLLKKVIPNDRLVQLKCVIDEFITQSKAVSESNFLFDLDPSHNFSNPCIRRLKNPHMHHDMFLSLSRDQSLVDPVAQLLGGTVRFDHSKLNFKPPNGKAEIAWHQDWAFYPHSNDDLLAVGVMLEDCTEENGPLMVIPGSHKGRVYDHHHEGVFAGGINHKDLGSLIDYAEALTAPAGSITLHHVRLLHASNNNVTHSTRPLLLFSYSAVDAFPIFDRYDIAEYNSRILRGSPTIEGRMAAIPFRIHQPQAKGADSIYDNQASMDVIL